MSYTLPREDRETDQVVFDIDVMQWVSSAGVNNPGTHVSEAFEVTSYSRDGNCNVTFGSREQLKTFSEPSLNVNLAEKYESFIPKDSSFFDGDEGVELMLRALLANSFDVDGQADIVTNRNNLNKIGTAPYATKREVWELDCALVGRTVFLDVRETREDSNNPAKQLFKYYGYRFESVCTGLSKEPVNANSAFYSISQLRIANHRILLASEIDCTSSQPHKGGNPLNGYIELKTTRSIKNDHVLNNMYRYRFLKYWLQSYLAGVPNIFLGIRSEAGELLDVKRLRTHDLPRQARQHFDRIRSRNRWEPFVCISFLDYVLRLIRKACYRNPGSTIRVRLHPLTKHVTGVLVAGPNQPLSARIMRVQQETPRR